KHHKREGQAASGLDENKIVSHYALLRFPALCGWLNTGCLWSKGRRDTLRIKKRFLSLGIVTDGVEQGNPQNSGKIAR
ncbi:MAG: hypothetical protein RR726_21145, partial [Pseudomonas sp.]